MRSRRRSCWSRGRGRSCSSRDRNGGGTFGREAPNRLPRKVVEHDCVRGAPIDRDCCDRRRHRRVDDDAALAPDGEDADVLGGDVGVVVDRADVCVDGERPRVNVERSVVGHRRRRRGDRESHVRVADVRRLDDLKRRRPVEGEVVDERRRRLGRHDGVAVTPRRRDLDVLLARLCVIRDEPGDDRACLVGADAPHERPARADVRIGWWRCCCRQRPGQERRWQGRCGAGC